MARDAGQRMKCFPYTARNWLLSYVRVRRNASTAFREIQGRSSPVSLILLSNVL